MKFTILTTSLILAGTIAHANCDDAWYVRNLAFDRAGYCFGSALGQAVFSPDCTTTSPVLDDWHQKMIAATKANEAAIGCSVDTTQTRLETMLAGKLDDVELLPTVAPHASACVGYQGAPLNMTAGIGMQMSYPTGTIVAGDTVYFQFESADGFEFAVTETAAGWIPEGMILPGACTQFAG